MGHAAWGSVSGNRNAFPRTPRVWVKREGISKHELTELPWCAWYCYKHKGIGESSGPFCLDGFIICRNITYIPGTSDGKRVIRSVTNCTGAGQPARGSAALTSEQSILGGGRGRGEGGREEEFYCFWEFYYQRNDEPNEAVISPAWDNLT